MNFKQKILDFVYPNNITCIVCGEDIDIGNRYNVCSRCLKEIEFNNSKICMKCGRPLKNNTCNNCIGTKHYFKLARAPLVYIGATRILIHKLKFGNLACLSESLAEFLYDEYVRMGISCDCVVAVPLHPRRYKTRGYNQSYELVKVLNKKLNLEDLSDCVGKNRDTPPQSSLNLERRRENVKHAFVVLDNRFRGKRVLVVDDVVTTTSTVDSLARILKQAGASEVYVLSIAHG